MTQGLVVIFGLFVLLTILFQILILEYSYPHIISLGYLKGLQNIKQHSHERQNSLYFHHHS